MNDSVITEYDDDAEAWVPVDESISLETAIDRIVKVNTPKRYSWNEEDHPRADDGKFGSGSGGDYTTHLTATFPDIIQRDIDSDNDMDETERKQWGKVLDYLRNGKPTTAAAMASRYGLDLGDYEPVFREKRTVAEAKETLGDWRQYASDMLEGNEAAAVMRDTDQIEQLIDAREYDQAKQINDRLTDEHGFDYLPTSMLADMVTGEYFS